MSVKSKLRNARAPWRGAAGNYALNQHAPRYADRRTRRNRSRGDRERNAMREQVQ